MILGVLSDTHGRYLTLRRALQTLKSLDAEAVVHCGDVGGDSVLDELAGQRAWFVWGNTDLAATALAQYARTIGLNPPKGVPLTLELAGRRIAVFHGHEPQFQTIVDRCEDYERGRHTERPCDEDIVLYGHTHRPRETWIGDVVFVNPGALHRAHTYTVATIDVRTRDVRFWEVPENSTTAQPRPYTLEE